MTNASKTKIDIEKVISSIGLDGFHIFEVVCSTGSINKASELLPLSSSAIGKRLSDIETILGRELVIRVYNGVLPTPYGQQMIRFWKASKEQLLSIKFSHPGMGVERERTKIVWSDNSFYELIAMDYESEAASFSEIDFKIKTLSPNLLRPKIFEEKPTVAIIHEINPSLATADWGNRLTGFSDLQTFNFKVPSGVIFMNPKTISRNLEPAPRVVYLSSGVKLGEVNLFEHAEISKMIETGAAAATLIAWAGSNLAAQDMIIVPRSAHALATQSGLKQVFAPHPNSVRRSFSCIGRRGPDFDVIKRLVRRISVPSEMPHSS